MAPFRPTKCSRSAISGHFVGGNTAPKKERSSLARGCDDLSRIRQLDFSLQRLRSGYTNSTSPPTALREPQCTGKETVTDEQRPAVRRTEPDQAAIDQHIAWKAHLPSLVNQALIYYASTSATPTRSISGIIHSRCSGACNNWTAWKLTALYLEHFVTVEVRYCNCRTLSDVLVGAGLFPSAPSQPRMAFSLELLDFYRALFNRASDAITAFAATINAVYIGRGFKLVDLEGRRLREPFRRSLSHADQWFDAVHVLIEKEVDDILSTADQRLVGLPSNPSPRKECSRLLRTLCPACFGLDKFGRSFTEGSDIHVATDGNFQHKHLLTGGQGIPTYDPEQILSKTFVDSVGERIDHARKSPHAHPSLKVPSPVVDQCEASHEAAKSEKKREHANGCKYDSVGWMALTCRHDVPLALADIDTPGERQKYAVALLLWLFAQLPEDATVTLLYDIGCVLHRSIQLYALLPVAIVLRLQIAVSVMHAYGHQWVCQLVYNPRFLKGLGLTDGECGEREWSLLRGMIVVVRTCSLAKRAALTSRRISFIASQTLRKLGDWILRRFRKGVEAQGSKARKILDDCPMNVEDLRNQWHHQKETQVSLSKTTSYSQSQSLKSDLDAIKSLQKQVDGAEKSLSDAKSNLSVTPITKVHVENLTVTHAGLVKTSQTLCASLNLHRHLPGLDGVDLEFVKLLLLARDLKENIRTRVIERLFELDRLDQASGGKKPLLGTKLQQSIQKSIKRRQPALRKAIEKYNQYCATLTRLNKPSFGIPSPNPLPTRLTDLREDPELLQDIWITPSSGEPPRWLICPQVRAGIRAMLKIDRCVEEESRLELETQNMIRWYSREIAAVETALVDRFSTPIGFRLAEHRANLLDLKAQWVYSLKDMYQFESRICAAEVDARAAARFYSERS